MSQQLEEHFCGVIQNASVEPEPFPHVVFDGVFPETVYDELLDSLPPPDAYRPLSERKYRLEDGTSTRDVLQLEPPHFDSLPSKTRALWEAVSQTLRSARVQQTLFSLFRSQLARRFKVAPDEVDELTVYPRPALIRDLGGYEITPHPDTSSKIVTVQLYLPRSEDQLEYGTSLYRRRLFKLENLAAPKRRFEFVKRLAFRRNSGYGFVVTRSSWHGRETLPMNGKVRNTLLSIYYEDPDKAY